VPSLPTGTVTFLLSDVEGSTSLWEQAPELMRVALSRHDALFEAAILEHGGAHIRPRGLTQPEPVYQLSASDLPSDFPSLASLNIRLHNLPMQRSALIGREREIAEVRALLLRPDVGLVTLVGPGGTGKTRLAAQVAAELVDQFEDGAYFVALAPIRDPDLVAATIGQALWYRRPPVRPHRCQMACPPVRPRCCA
jgi:class 3 adenylate cyclase